MNTGCSTDSGAERYKGERTAGERQAPRGKRVTCIVLNSFVNDSRVLRTCRSLISAGYWVEIIALHDGQSGLPEHEVVHGISVHRVKLSTKRWWRARAVQHLKYLEFLVRVCRRYRESDIYHCNDLAALPIGVMCRLLSRGMARIVYDAHEHESERNGFSPMMRCMTRVVERALIRYADRVITVSPSIAEDYERLYGVPRPEVIYNVPYYIEKRQTDQLRGSLGIGNTQSIFLYQGALTKGRGIETMLRVFAGLGDRYCLVLIGDGPLSSMIQEWARRYANIFHIPAVEPMSLWELTFSADYGIALIENTCRSYYLCLPNKLFEFMMAELPVIVSDMFELERFVRTHGVGIVSVVAEDELRKSVMAIVEADRERYVSNIRAVKARYTWERQEATLTSVYGRVSGLGP